VEDQRSHDCERGTQECVRHNTGTKETDARNKSEEQAAKMPNFKDELNRASSVPMASPDLARAREIADKTAGFA
jgi:hypothetical protein